MGNFSYPIFYGIFCLPTVLSYVFADRKDFVFFSSSLLFLFSSSFFVFMVGSTIFRKRAFQLLFNQTLLLAVCSFEIAQSVSCYLQGDGFNTRFFQNFSFENILLTWNAYPEISFLIILYFCLIIILIFFCTINYTFRQWHLIGLLLFSFCTLFLDYPLKSFVKKHYGKASAFSENMDIRTMSAFGLNPKAAPPVLQKAVPGKNLVLIYLESIEKIFTDTSIFPLLTPNINTLINEGISFNEFVQTPGTGCTISGIFSSQCGTPLLLPSMMSANDIISNGYFQNAICMGDILGEAGYEQVYLGGARSDFAGKGDFLLSHGYEAVKGFGELQSELEHSDYFTGWGLYDDTLFDLAAREYIRLAENGKPFNLTLLTLDTHPEGFASRSCTPYTEKNNRMLNAVHCTDQLLMKFIETISSYPAYNRTIVAIITDHLMMRSGATQYFPENYPRTLLFLLLNTGKSYPQNQLMTHMDVAPTLLSALGVTYDSHFLYGRNMLEYNEKQKSIDYADPKLIEMTKSINEKYFSSHSLETTVESDVILDFQKEGKMKIGNRNVSVSYQGIPLSTDKFSKDFGMFMVMNENGKIVDSTVIHINDLVPLFLDKANSNDLFILTLPNRPLPLNLNRLVSRDGDGLSAVLGRFSGPVVNLGAFHDPATLKISTGKIEQAMRSINGSSTEALISPLKWLTNEYKKKCGEGAAIPFDNRESGLIHISCIKAGPNLFTAQLKRKDKKTYQLENITPLKQVDSNACCAYFAFGHLFMPLALNNGTIKIMKLTPIPDTKPLQLKSQNMGKLDTRTLKE
ncbi:arylsulfatase [delta proteobacterium NaphS2]|nr:arylsulfatase [delta proteobacterium NaphS2]